MAAHQSARQIDIQVQYRVGDLAVLASGGRQPPAIFAEIGGPPCKGAHA